MPNQTKKVEVFETPRLLQIEQYVEYDPEELRYGLATGLLNAAGCRRGVCVKYRAWVSSNDGERWEARERWRRRRDEEAGGCIRQQVADALWELAERGYNVEVDKDCNVVVNGVSVGIFHCRTVDRCVEEILKYYEHVSKEPPKQKKHVEDEEYEELLRRYPRLRWWNKSIIIDIIKKGGPAKWGMVNLFEKLTNVDERVWAFLARFNLNLTCIIDVFRSGEELCVKFYIDNCEPRVYCHKAGRGWYAVNENPKFIKLMPVKDSIVEVYTIAGKEYIKVA